MKTSDYPVWLAVQREDRDKVRAAAGLLEDGRAAVVFDGKERLWMARPGCDIDRIREWLPDRSMRAGGGDPESEFLDVLTQAGLIIKGMPVMDGKKHTVATTQNKGGKKSGVYCGFLDGRPAGWFINYHTSDGTIKWSSKGGDPDPVASLHIRAAAKQSQDDATRKRAAKQAAATSAAKKLYDKLPAVSPSHPYLVRKGIPPTPELRVTRNGALVVPFFSAQGEFRTLQYIPGAGDKYLFEDGPKMGNFLVVGGTLENGQPISYAEGYATARSLNLATGHPVVMTIDAGNMVNVAEILHREYPDSPHFFFADFDHDKDENKGLVMASRAAELVGGKVLYPNYNAGEISKKFSDFNDLHQSRGLDAVREQAASLFAQLHEVPTMAEQPVTEAQIEPEISPSAQPPMTPESAAAHVLRVVRAEDHDADFLLMAEKDLNRFVGETLARVKGETPQDNPYGKLPVLWTGETEIKGFVVRDGVVEETGGDAPDYLSVYAKDRDGASVWVADFDSEERAQEFTSSLRMIDQSARPLDLPSAQAAVEANDVVAEELSVALETARDDQIEQILSLEAQESRILATLQSYYDNYDAEGATIYEAESGLVELRSQLKGLRDQQLAESAEKPPLPEEVSSAGVEPLEEVAASTQTLGDDSPVQASHLASTGPLPLTFSYNDRPAMLNLQGLVQAPLPEVAAPELTQRAAPAMPNLTFNGEPVRSPAAAVQEGPEQTVIAPQQQEVAERPGPVEADEARPVAELGSSANAQQQPTSVPADSAGRAPAIEPEMQPAQAETLLATKIAPVEGAQLVDAATAAGLTEEQIAWARTQPWFDGAGQDEQGAYVRAREQRGKRVQWLFRKFSELMPWAEKERALTPQPAAVEKAKAPVADNSAEVETPIDAIHVGPRIGVDEPKPGVEDIDKDRLLTRLTPELQGDKSMLYKLDGEPAFIDRGTRLEMASGAGQSDEKIVAALLTAARFYRGEIELTGSDAFKAKAIELIVLQRVNVQMKTPEQREMLEKARQVLNVPAGQPDAFLGATPPPFDPAPSVPAAPATPGAAQAPVDLPAKPAMPMQPAAPVAGNDVPAPVITGPAVPANVAVAPLSGQVGSENGGPSLSGPVMVGAAVPGDSQPLRPQPPDVPPSVHQPSKNAAEGVTGKVMSCGQAPFRFDPDNDQSTHITLRTKTGTQTFWGKELAGLLRDSRVEPGRMVTLKFEGQKPVVVKAPVKEDGKVVRFEERSTHRNQWQLSILNGPTVRTGDDQGVKLTAYDAARFGMIQSSVLSQLNMPIEPPTLPNDGLFWMTPNGQGSAKSGDELTASRPAEEKNDAGKLVASSWSADGHLDMALFRGDGHYLQGVVRYGDGYRHVLVSLPGHAEAAPMVFNAITEQGLVPIGVGNGINESGGQPVARDHIAFRLEGDSAVRIGRLDFPGDVPPALHARMGFDERWKDTNNLPKSAPAAAPSARPDAVRPS